MSLLINFVWTLNNYTEEENQNVIDWCRDNTVYTIIGREVGAEGTPHLQGYTELKKKTRFTTIKGIFTRAHIEPRKGTQQEALTYCKKEKNFIEIGEPRKQGARVDLDKVRTIALDEGMRAVTARFNLQQIKVAEKYLQYNEEAREFKPNVIWLWGPTGSGKSRRARELCDDDVFTKNSGNKWWDGYDSHASIIIDDFRPSWWDLTYMLALLDRYPMYVEIKGGGRQMLARTMIVTSAFPPEKCYTNTGEAITQLIRRIDEIHYVGPAVPDVPEVGEGNTIDFPNNILDILNI